MSDARATIKHAIIGALTETSPLTGLVADSTGLGELIDSIIRHVFEDSGLRWAAKAYLEETGK